MNPTHLKLLKKAQALDLAGKAKEAALAYRAFLDVSPRHADTWADYAGMLLNLGQHEEARRACEAALLIDPAHPTAGIKLGVSLMRLDQLKQAEAQLRLVLAEHPLRLDGQLSLAECLLHRQDLEGAQAALEQSGKPGPGGLQKLQSGLWTALGLSYLEIQRFHDAEAACLRALQMDPGDRLARSTISATLMGRGHLEEAEDQFRKRLREDPLDQNARMLLITCLSKQGDLEGVRHEIATVLAQAPRDFIVHKGITGTCASHGWWEDYQAEIARFRAVAPDWAFLDYEQALVDLLFGRMREGWVNFEARLRIRKELRMKERTFAQPAWTGESFAGKTLLLWVEQGLGDTLMFLRYVPLVKALGGHVVVEAQPPLLDLVATCPGVDLVIPARMPWPSFDLQASLMSLPRIFQTEVDSVPAQVPYLEVPAEVPNRQMLLEALDLARDCTRIGVVWAGSPGHGRDAERSLPVELLAPLGDLPGVAWFSFQHGKDELPPLPSVVPLAAHFSTFSDTAYALAGLDLLITVDTSVAHLAGAMGVPTFLLLAFQPDYRWLLDRDDSPWYPTLRLYRQPRYNDWESVIQQIVDDLTGPPEDPT